MADDWDNWEDLVPETDAFTITDMLIPYKGGWSAEFGRKLARNTSYNWRHSDKELVIDNETFTPGQTKTYDVGRNYVGSYIYIVRAGDSGGGPFPMPYYFAGNEAYLDPAFHLLSTSEEGMIVPLISDSWHIKALAGGGIWIEYNGGTDGYLTCLIIELRKIIGA